MNYLSVINGITDYNLSGCQAKIFSVSLASIFFNILANIGCPGFLAIDNINNSQIFIFCQFFQFRYLVGNTSHLLAFQISGLAGVDEKLFGLIFHFIIFAYVLAGKILRNYYFQILPNAKRKKLVGKTSFCFELYLNKLSISKPKHFFLLAQSVANRCKMGF